SLVVVYTTTHKLHERNLAPRAAAARASAGALRHAWRLRTGLGASLDVLHRRPPHYHGGGRPRGHRDPRPGAPGGPRVAARRGGRPGGGGPGGRRSCRARAGGLCGGDLGHRHGARARVTAAGGVALLVVRLSDSFADFWPALARELDVPLTEWTPGPEAAPPPRAGVVLVAAGGHETQIGAVLPLLGIPPGIPVLAVGASTSHRVAAQAVAAGASDYFALP